MPAAEIAALKPKGLILSGGPSSVYSPKAPLPDPAIFKLGIPILGICYGVQLMAQFLGGKVEPGQKREYGKGTLSVIDGDCALFAGLPASLQVWNSHGDKLAKMPKGFKAVAASDNSEFAAIEDRARHFFGLQFHPEVAHTPAGARSWPILSTRFAAAAGTGRCAIIWTRPWRKSASKAGDGARNPGLERRGGFQRGGGPVAQGHWRAVDLHLCQ